ncbi:MAG TPA: hypothetical protein VFV70_01895, partial [Hyphomonadaceae bacterium]|nr:hypothetical protein [Hyphomonadaceae bacterium]
MSEGTGSSAGGMRAAPAHHSPHQPKHTHKSGEHVQQERFRRGAGAWLRKFRCTIRGARTRSSRRPGFLYALVAAHISLFYRAQVGEVA